MGIIAKCAVCTNTYSVKPSRFKRPSKPLYCSRSCYLKKIATDGHPNRRNFLTANCERCGSDFEVRRKRDAANRRFCGAQCRAAWQASLPYCEWRGKLSANVANRPRGVRNPRFGKPPLHPGKALPYVTVDGEVVKFRSSWELQVARYLDRHRVAWRYEPRRFDLGDTTYVPDFYLVEDGCFWEVKGWFHDKAKQKLAKFREMYPDEIVVVITKHAFGMIANDNREHDARTTGQTSPHGPAPRQDRGGR